MLIQFLWDDDKTRKLLRKHLILVIFGSTPVLVYGLIIANTSPYVFILAITPFVSIIISILCFMFINKIRPGLLFLLNILVIQLVTTLNMAASGGFASIVQFVPYALIFMTVFQLGPSSTLILAFFTTTNLVLMSLFLLSINFSIFTLYHSILYITIYIVLTIIFHNIGNELSYQIDAKKRLEEVDDLKNQFIALSSHYLRTPLTLVQGSLSHLEKTVLDTEQEQDVRVIDKGTKDLDSLSEKLLTITTIEKGQAKIIPTKQDLNLFLTKIVDESKPEADKKKVNLVYQSSRQPLPNFNFDNEKLKQAILHLIDNAIKFNRINGTVTVSLYKDENNAVIKISDNGIGIKKEAQETLFSTFNRAGMERTLTFDNPGMGLSLYLTKLIIDAHKGKITVDSTENQGSTFTITLPIK